MDLIFFFGKFAGEKFVVCFLVVKDLNAFLYLKLGTPKINSRIKLTIEQFGFEILLSWLRVQKLQNGITKSVDPNQAAPTGAVRSGSRAVCRKR